MGAQNMEKAIEHSLSTCIENNMGEKVWLNWAKRSQKFDKE